MDEKITQMLIEEAAEARKQSFSPFSGFAVGAALMQRERSTEAAISSAAV